VGGCSSDAQCAASDECKTAACVDGVCVESLAPEGKLVYAGIIPGDCKRRQCSADGQIVDVVDETDKPEDHNPCTTESCAGGVPSSVPDAAMDGASCGAGSQTICTAGVCTGCNNDSQCPKGGTCEKPVCNGVAGSTKSCGFEKIVGVEVSNVDPHDCFHSVCDANGLIVPVPLTTDTPLPDDNDCDVESCGMTGMVIHAPVMDGTACGGSSTCNPSSCAAGKCVMQPYPGTETALPMQTAGDCMKVVCDGKGGTTQIQDAADLPADANPSDCMVWSCAGTGPMMVPAAAGTACAGGVAMKCDAMGTCT